MEQGRADRHLSFSYTQNPLIDIVTGVDYNLAMAVENKEIFSFISQVRRALVDFPVLRENVVFIDTNENSAGNKSLKFHGGWQTKFNILVKKRFPGVLTKLQEWRQYPQNRESCGILSNTGDLVIMHYNADTLSKNPQFLFDHELGHLVVPEARNEDNPSECRADAFAAIRHLKRTGETDFLTKLSWERAYRFVQMTANSPPPETLSQSWAQGYRDTAHHLTTTVLDAVINASEAIINKDLSSEDTALLAAEYAKKYQLEKPILLQLKREYGALNKLPEDCSDQVYHNAIASIALATPNRATFQIGMSAILYTLNKGYKIEPILINSLNRKLSHYKDIIEIPHLGENAKNTGCQILPTTHQKSSGQQ